MKTSERSYILFPGDPAGAGWKLAACDATANIVWHDVPVALGDPAAADLAPEKVARAVAEALPRLLGTATTTTLTLAIPSGWCLCAAVDAVDPAAGRVARREAMLYRLEEKLPLAAEEFVADFVAGGNDSRTALGVAAPLATLGPIVRTIENAGWVVETVAPAALLAAQRYVETGAMPASCDALLFAHDGQLDLLELADGRLAGWAVLPADAGDVAMELGLRVLQHHGPLSVACAGVPSEVVERLRRIAELQVTEIELPDSRDSAAAMAHAISRDGAAGWVQLRRDALGTADRLGPARRAIKAAAIAAVVFVVCFCAAMVWRASTYQQIAADAEAEQSELFAKVFDGKRPAEGLNIRSRLATEERRLRALAGESLELPSRPSALVLLHRVLERLPAADGARCQIDELRIEEEKLYIEGTAPSHADAAMFATALGTGGAFDVESPRTAQLGSGADGVSMTISGRAGAEKVSPPARDAAPAAAAAGQGEVEP